MSEFFVLRKSRRRGVGRIAACELLERFPGAWKVRKAPGSGPATAFWRSVIPTDFDETTSEDGVVQRFEVTAS